ncbi:MAG: hypothetical protein FJZ88_08450 [Chloroflexi bacterium]|nr:hypothetical protein [Chloroflexota bacterium]
MGETGKVERCVDCAFMAWDQKREKFFCGRTLEYKAVMPQQSACEHGVEKVYRKRRQYQTAYQLCLIEERSD